MFVISYSVLSRGEGTRKHVHYNREVVIDRVGTVVARSTADREVRGLNPTLASHEFL